MKNMLLLTLLAVFYSCSGNDPGEQAKDYFVKKSEDDVKKKYGDNKFSKSLVHYFKENTDVEVIKNDPNMESIDVKFTTAGKDILFATELYAMSSNLNKVTMDDMIDVIKSKGANIEKMKPLVITTSCTFETNKRDKLKTCLKL